MESWDRSAHVAGNIRRLRQQRGWTLEDLSAALDKLGHPLGFNVLSKLEQNKRRIDVNDLSAIAEAFSIDPGQLLHGSPEEAEALRILSDWKSAEADVTDAIRFRWEIWIALSDYLAGHPEAKPAVKDRLQRLHPDDPERVETLVRILENYRGAESYGEYLEAT